MIFAARQLQEKCQEQYYDLFITLIDLTKAFDTVCRGGLRQIMEKIGCSRKSIALVRQLHDGMSAIVLDNGDTSDSFPVTNGVKQGCGLAPTLFSMVFAAMLNDASKDNDDGIQLNYRTDRRVFNLRRLKAKTKVKVATLGELLSADDCALNSNTEAEIQQCVNHFSRACDNFGFTISIKKTQVMHQPAPRKMYHEPHIFGNDAPLKATDYFTYQGSTLSREANIGNQQHTFQSQLCIWKTQHESVGTTRNQPRHQAKCIHGCSANRPAICMRVMDCVQPSRQKTQPLPYTMFADYFEN